MRWQNCIALAAVMAGTLGATAVAGPNAGPTARPPAPKTFTYDAVVNRFGVLRRHSGAVSAAMTAVGEYQVEFSQDVSACTIVVSQAAGTESGGPIQKPGFISAAVSTDDPQLVLVEVRNLRAALHIYALHLLVAC